MRIVVVCLLDCFDISIHFSFLIFSLITLFFLLPVNFIFQDVVDKSPAQLRWGPWHPGRERASHNWCICHPVPHSSPPDPRRETQAELCCCNVFMCRRREFCMMSLFLSVSLSLCGHFRSGSSSWRWLRRCTAGFGYRSVASGTIRSLAWSTFFVSGHGKVKIVESLTPRTTKNTQCVHCALRWSWAVMAVRCWTAAAWMALNICNSNTIGVHWRSNCGGGACFSFFLLGAADSRSSIISDLLLTFVIPRRNLFKFLPFFIHCCLCCGYLHCLRHRNKFVYQIVMLQWIVPFSCNLILMIFR